MSSCMTKRSVKRVPAARRSPRLSRSRASFQGSRSIPARSPLPAPLKRPSPRGLTVSAIGLSEYRSMNARFAKWRAVIRVTDTLPSSACVSANAHALARYAALCQEQELMPIVEPEVLMDGSHTIDRCEEVTGVVLHAVFNALSEQGVALEGMLLKPNMVVAGKACTRQAFVEDVATATLRCLRRHVPAAVPGIVFLSGGQNARLATVHLNAINRLSRPEALENQFLLRAGAAGSGSGGLAWAGRKSGCWPECPLPPSQLQRCGERWEIHGRDGAGIGKR